MLVSPIDVQLNACPLVKLMPLTQDESRDEILIIGEVIIVVV